MVENVCVCEREWNKRIVSFFLFPEGQKFITVSYERCLSGDIMNITVQRQVLNDLWSPAHTVTTDTIG